MNNKVKLLVLVIVIATLLFAACQTEEATPTKESATEPAPAAAETDAPADTPEPAPDVNDILTASLSELVGLVEIKLANTSEFADASSDLILDVNGQVRTGDDGKVRLDLSSGTIVRVSPSSLFTLTSNEEVEGGLLTKIRMELGQIFVILNGGSLEVETPSGVASVRGSYLKVEMNSAGDTLELTCLEGDCSVVAPNGETINFTDGQKVVIKKDPETGEWIVEEGPMTTEDFNEWLENNPEAQALVEAGLTSLGGSTGGGGAGCVTITEPADASDYFAFGEVNFGWEPRDDAASYIVTFTYPDGTIVQFSTADTGITRHIESMPPGGSYSWNVTPVDEGGNPICTSEGQTFTKADTNQWYEEQEQKKKDNEPACDPCDPYGDCFTESYYCYYQLY